jgi:hypothetical protein
MAAIDRTISSDSTVRMRRSRLAISPWVEGMLASGAKRRPSLPYTRPAFASLEGGAPTTTVQGRIRQPVTTPFAT